jgi:hypothetical protein
VSSRLKSWETEGIRGLYDLLRKTARKERDPEKYGKSLKEIEKL